MYRWLRPGLYLKRWVLLLSLGITIISISVAQLVIFLYQSHDWPGWVKTLTLSAVPPLIRAVVLLVLGVVVFSIGFYRLNRSLAEPLGSPRSVREWLQLVQTHQQLRQGIHVVAVGGGTGLPSALRAMKSETSNITAIVTMADDGGSSGRLRRDFGMQPPGDLRSNITALAHDEALMTRLFDYRFPRGELGGHSFGNLLLAALYDLEGGMDQAADAAGRILAIQGRVLPCTLTDVHLVAEVRHRQSNKMMLVQGESNIPSTDWKIEKVALRPENASVHSAVLDAIRSAQLLIIGPGSLYTSILPNLIVDGVAEALRRSTALKVYICNIAIQPGETDGYHVGDHVVAIEHHVGKSLVDVILANNHYPLKNAGPNTIYVQPAPEEHDIYKHYRVIYGDLTDDERPWRHSPQKLQHILLALRKQHKNADQSAILPKGKFDMMQQKAQQRSSGKIDILR